MEAVSKNLCINDSNSTSVENVTINTERVPLAVAMNAIEFIYTGIIPVTPETVGNTLLIANQWCLDELRICILRHLRNQICCSFQKPKGTRGRNISIEILQVGSAIL